MNEHPIEGLMLTAMSSIREMIDVNTIIGEPIETIENIVIIPISKVSFGFAAGGSEFKGETIDEYTKSDKEEEIQYRLPFGGGAGAGVSINPVSFLVIQNGNAKLIPVEHASCMDRLLDYIPDVLEKFNTLINNNMKSKAEKNEQIINQIKKNTSDILKGQNGQEKQNEPSLKTDFKEKEFEQKTTKLANENEIPQNYEINAESDGEDM